MRTTVLVLLGMAQLASAQPPSAGAYAETAAGRQPLSALFVWSPILGRNIAWPIDHRRHPEIRLDEAVMLPRVTQASPSLVVSGFPASGGWQLVALHDRAVRLRRKSAYGSDFMSNAIFEQRDTVPLAYAAANGDELRLRPASPLAAGAYMLCGQLQDGGWMRVCFAMEVAP